jgi:hypothetical protein
MLRYLLVQDLDLNDDGRPETLRLGFATPRRWLEDGKRIRIENAPTAFGRVSYSVESRLRIEEVIADVDLPVRNKPERCLFRLRLPDGWKIVQAKCKDAVLSVDGTGTIDLTAFSGRQMIRYVIAKNTK